MLRERSRLGAQEGPMPTILLVEDDEAVSEVIRQHLADIGHAVIGARDTADAQQAFSAQQPIDLLLVDLVMPVGQPDGLAFATQARAQRPGIPIIFLTAYYGFVVRAGPMPGAVLYKPVDLNVLTREINAALDH
jgi:CheY-like chemotaxis protein